jgi:hypothetical protein
MKKLLYAVIVILFLIIIFKPELQVIDDHGLLDTLMSGKFFNKYVSGDMFRIGRFYPLGMQEFNLLYFITGKSDVQNFYILIGLEFLGISWLLCRIMSTSAKGKNEKYYFLFVLALILTPGFVTAFLRLHIGERNVLFFFLLFLFMYTRYQENHKGFYAIAALIFANLSLYYKEPVFLMLGTFVLFHLLLSWKDLNGKQKGFDGLLLLSSFVFITVYYIIVFGDITGNRYGVYDLPYSNFVFIRTFLNLVIFDPILSILVPVTLLYRITDFFRSHSSEPIYDSMLFASIAYVVSFFILKMQYAHHYFLPAYAPGIVALGYFLITKNYLVKKGIRLAILIVVFLYLTNALPSSLHLVSFYKNSSRNFQETLDFLEKYKKTEKGYTRIFLDGVNRGSGVEVYHSFLKYLKFRGLTKNDFDIMSDEETDSRVLFSLDPESPYSVYNNSNAYEPTQGDLVVVSPHSKKGVNKEYLVSLSDDYELLFRTKSLFYIPVLTLKETSRYLLLKFYPPSGSFIHRNKGTTSDYFVYRKKP